MKDAPFSAAHCRAARGLLNLSQAELAELAQVGRMTVARIEGDGQVRPAQAAAVRRALEDAGVVFLTEGAVVDGRQALIGVVRFKPGRNRGPKWPGPDRQSTGGDSEPDEPPVGEPQSDA